MPLWGQDCPLLALAASACLSHVGNGPVTSLLALLCPLFCEHSWQFLRLELFTVQFSLSLSLSFFSSLSLAIPQSGLLSHVSSLKVPLGHSGLVHSLSNAAQASLSSPRLLVVDASIWPASALGVAVRQVICGF